MQSVTAGHRFRGLQWWSSKTSKTIYGSASEIEYIVLRITVFRDVTSYGLAGECKCFGRIYCCNLQGIWGWDIRFFRVIGTRLPDGTASRLGRGGGNVILTLFISKKSSVCFFFIFLQNVGFCTFFCRLLVWNLKIARHLFCIVCSTHLFTS